jgi:hypothetical protein
MAVMAVSVAIRRGASATAVVGGGLGATVGKTVREKNEG